MPGVLYLGYSSNHTKPACLIRTCSFRVRYPHTLNKPLLTYAKPSIPKTSLQFPLRSSLLFTLVSHEKYWVSPQSRCDILNQRFSNDKPPLVLFIVFVVYEVVVNVLCFLSLTWGYNPIASQQSSCHPIWNIRSGKRDNMKLVFSSNPLIFSFSLVPSNLFLVLSHYYPFFVSSVRFEFIWWLLWLFLLIAFFLRFTSLRAKGGGGGIVQCVSDLKKEEERKQMRQCAACGWLMSPLFTNTPDVGRVFYGDSGSHHWREE